jgi:hypothetical protein
MLDLLSLLPNLKSFTTPGLPLFDAPSLFKLSASVQKDSTIASSVRVLNISYCRNIVSRSFISTIPYFKSLVYLDVSSAAVINADVLKAIASIDLLPYLEILKLRNLGLGDSHIKHLATGLGTRLWCLDVRGNYLTDDCVPTILDNCFTPPEYQDLDIDEAKRPSITVKEDSEEWHVTNCLAQWGTLWPNRSIKPSGLTQLYISGNKLGPSACAALIQAQRLDYLDHGDFPAVKLKAATSQKMQSAGTGDSSHSLLELVKAQPYTIFNPFRKLRWLRVDHRVVSMAFDDQVRKPQNSKAESTNDIQTIKCLVENIYHLRAIVLTGIPTTTQSLDLVSSLKEFISAFAAAEVSAAEKQVSSLDGSKSPASNPNLPHLPTLVLELESESRDSRAKQDAEDSRDVSALSRALQQDFSFFDNEKEESASTAPLSPSQSRIVSPQSTGTTSNTDTSELSAEPLDVIRELSTLRKICKARQDSARQRGEAVSPGSYGYWSGKISIVRDGKKWYDEPEREVWTMGVRTRWG